MISDDRFKAPSEPSRRRFVVCGAPGSGKSAWVQAHWLDGDLVFDMDVIATAIARCPQYPRPPAVLDALIAMRQAFIGTLLQRPECDAFVIIADPEEAARMAARLGAEVVTLSQQCVSPMGVHMPRNIAVAMIDALAEREDRAFSKR